MTTSNTSSLSLRTAVLVGAALLACLGTSGARPGVSRAPSYSRGSWGRSRGRTPRYQTGRPYSGRTTGNFHAPARDYQNRAITARPVANIGGRGDLVRGTIGNRGVVANVRGVVSVRGDMDGRYHWYNQGGVRFCHWYDAPYGRHWFGFYAGNAFFWSIYWNDYFWWYEPGFGRWLWFYDGNWWWYGPGGVAYVYVGDGYYTWEEEGEGEVLVPAQAQGAKLPPKEQPAYHYSGDGTRLVQVEGAEHAAFLYDLTHKDAEGNYQLIRFLGNGVTKVQFTNPSYGGATQIILETKDAGGKTSRQALDPNGNPIQPGAGSGEAPAPPQGIPDPSKLPKAPESMSAPVPSGVKPPATPSGAQPATTPGAPTSNGNGSQ